MRPSRIISAATCLLLLGAAAPGAEKQSPTTPTTSPSEAGNALAAARDNALAWLTKNQAADGSWGKTYKVAITSFACLSYLGSSDEPFQADGGKALVRGLGYLVSVQKDGQFEHNHGNWIHGQGFATLALSEAYGRALLCKTKPDVDMQNVRAVVEKAVAVIAANQSNSGGWWYTPGNKASHEGSTTVCTVQALVSADNYGIKIDRDVLDKGFEYLKKSQNKDGGFDYRLDNSPNTTSMKEGTAGGVATLGLMRKFDYTVMMNGYKFLLNIGPATISKGSFPYYGHFYGCMGMRLLGQEFKSLRGKLDEYAAGAKKDVLSWQGKDGSWPTKGWDSSGEGDAYGTAFATLILLVDEGRLSIFNRKPPKLPAPAKATS